MHLYSKHQLPKIFIYESEPIYREMRTIQVHNEMIIIFQNRAQLSPAVETPRRCAVCYNKQTFK